MSERALDKNQETSGTGQRDLTDLRASKDLHTKEPLNPSNETDLSSISISTSNIVRVAHKPETRRTPLSHTTSQSASPAAQTTKHSQNRSAGTPAPGLFKNPTYRYSGGPIGRLITFIANLLKVLERIFLRLLGARDQVAPNPLPQQAKQSSSPAPSEEKSKEKQARPGWTNSTTRS
jgi:hypothetical protein